jgi:hypothetical protein
VGYSLISSVTIVCEIGFDINYITAVIFCSVTCLIYIQSVVLVTPKSIQRADVSENLLCSRWSRIMQHSIAELMPA